MTTKDLLLHVTDEDYYGDEPVLTVMVPGEVSRYFAFYNQQRYHHSLKYRTPAVVYQGAA